MNYFAHGRRFIDDPYFLAGTALPDWLNVVDRRLRVRSKQAAQFVDAADATVARLAAGVMQHHADDGWFHVTPAFAELSLDFARRVRESLPADDGFRPHFLGHILVEILLDATLIEREPDLLEAYYAVMDSLNGERVAAAVNTIAPRPAENLATFVGMFSRERFLFDYLDDGKLLFRLNQVMRRVGLPVLPASFAGLLAELRPDVNQHAYQLLRPEERDLPQSTEMEESDELTEAIIGAAIEVHRVLGPGLLETIYEQALAVELRSRGHVVQFQVEFDVTYKGEILKGQRLDLLVDGEVIVEVKSVAKLPDMATAQLLSYLKATKLKRGLLLNFGCPRMIDGIKRLSL